MSRIFITGSSDGLGLMAAQLLIEQGHGVVLHARNQGRARDAQAAAPGAEAVVIGDLSSIAETRAVADQVNRLGRCDAVIHNAAIGYQEPRPIPTPDGLPHLFAINTLAPYILTALITRPDRLVYLTSGLQNGAALDLDDLLWRRRRWSGIAAYSESKLCDVLRAFAVARRWPDVRSNAVDPGWVATKMGGPGAPDDLSQAHRTQAWLAAGEDGAADVSSRYFYYLRPHTPDARAHDRALQDRLIAVCQEVSGVTLSEASTPAR